MPACGPVLPPSEGRNPLTMIKERLPAGSFRGTKTIRLTGGSGMTLRRFLGRLPDGGSGGDLEVSRARGRGRIPAATAVQRHSEADDRQMANTPKKMKDPT